MMRQYELVERVKAYDPSADEDLLNRAYVFSMKAHGTQLRASGDPYFSHPVEVAGLLSEMRLDCASIATGLLHDTVEDTVATLDDIGKLFGSEVAQLVDGVTKLSRLELQSDHARQAENFRKLLLAMSRDIRVLLVKLADRLHNMRTLRSLNKAEKRRRIARETMEIYAPLAERIGIRDWKNELEDLAFGELNPDMRSSIVKRLEFLRAEGGGQIAQATEQLTSTLADHGMVADIAGREKTPYSIWRKMQEKEVAFEQLSDIMAFRVIVDGDDACYRALGAIHARYAVVPGRFKDYISIPKSNGYRSLHTCVMGPGNQRVEVQIRSREMHEVAELGVAAHWQYKQDVQTDGRQYRWLRELLEILEHAEAPEEFLEHTKLEMFSDQVFCFTPKGDLITLPHGATPVDLAYAVHSDIGNTCVGAKINGRIAPLRTELRNGDQVEVLTSRAQTPSPTWEGFVVTGKARACIRRFVRGQRRAEYAKLGREIVEKTFRQHEYDLTEKAVKIAAEKLDADSPEDLYVLVGEGQYTGRDALRAAYPGSRQATVRPRPRQTAKARDPNNQPIPIRGLIAGMAVHFAGCCHPLPGDRIVGIVTTGKGVTVHTIDCDSLESFQEAPERWLDLSWDEAEGKSMVGRIKVVLANEPGSLGTLSTVIGRDGGNISNLKIASRSPDFFEILIDIEVADNKHLNNIMGGLRATPVICSVDRPHG